MPQSPPPPRRLATSAQVHPKFLPYIHAPKPFLRGPAARRFPAYAAAACLGYAIVTYEVSKQADPAHAYVDSRLTKDRMALLDAYGGRDSLEELEMAARVYEAQQGQGRR